MDTPTAPEPIKQKPVVTKPVTIVRRDGDSVLVEWMDVKAIRRVWVKDSDIAAGKVAESILETGVSYGLPLEKMFSDIRVTAAELAEEFHRNGLWTMEDFTASPRVVVTTVQRLTGLHIGGILRKIKEK